MVVVDNGSTDGTAEYLATLNDVRVVRNADNRGFPAAVRRRSSACAQLTDKRNNTP